MSINTIVNSIASLLSYSVEPPPVTSELDTRVATAARAATSASLGQNIVWSFPPVPLSTPNVNASTPQIAIDAIGNLVAVWVENGIVLSNSKPVNMPWGITTNTLSNSGASNPGVVSDPNGNTTAVWVENNVIQTAEKPFNGNWKPSEALSDTGADFPQIAVDRSGLVVAAWIRNGGVETSNKLFGQPWQNIMVLETSGASFPRISIGGDGDAKTYVVLWNSYLNGMNTIHAARKLMKGMWAPTEIISDTRTNAGYGDITVDPHGDITAVWFRYGMNATNNFSNVVVQTSDFSLSQGGWTPVRNLSGSGIRDPKTLIVRVGSDGLGNKIALWNQSFDDRTFNIESAVKPAYSSNWTSPVDLSTGNLYSYSTDLAITPLGAIALNMFYNGTNVQIQSLESDVTSFMNNSWSSPFTVSVDGQNGFSQIAASMTQNTVNTAAIWLNFNGTNTVVLTSTGVKNGLIPPSNLSVKQNANNFGIFTEYSNTVTWQASSDPTVAGYLVYRNGVFLAQVPANILQFVDDNQLQGGQVAYGVASVDNQQSRSAIQTVSFP